MAPIFVGDLDASRLAFNTLECVSPRPPFHARHTSFVHILSRPPYFALTDTQAPCIALSPAFPHPWRTHPQRQAFGEHSSRKTRVRCTLLEAVGTRHTLIGGDCLAGMRTRRDETRLSLAKVSPSPAASARTGSRSSSESRALTARRAESCTGTHVAVAPPLVRRPRLRLRGAPRSRSTRPRRRFLPALAGPHLRSARAKRT